MAKWITPEGYLTSGDVAQMSSLRGQQVYWFLQDHGESIGGRRCIRKDLFEALRRSGELCQYVGYSVYLDAVRGKGLKKPYRRRIGKKSDGNREFDGRRKDWISR